MARELKATMSRRNISILPSRLKRDRWLLSKKAKKIGDI
jgi:hypothetical protein